MVQYEQVNEITVHYDGIGMYVASRPNEATVKLIVEIGEIGVPFPRSFQKSVMEFKLAFPVFFRIVVGVNTSLLLQVFHARK